MGNDYKIGVVVGLLLIVAGVIYLMNINDPEEGTEKKEKPPVVAMDDKLDKDTRGTSGTVARLSDNLDEQVRSTSEAEVEKDEPKSTEGDQQQDWGLDLKTDDSDPKDVDKDDSVKRAEVDDKNLSVDDSADEEKDDQLAVKDKDKDKDSGVQDTPKFGSSTTDERDSAQSAGRKAGGSDLVPSEAKRGDVFTGSDGKKYYIVDEGDSFWEIAAKKEVYGGGRYHGRLQKANPDVNPRSLRAGMIIYVPEFKNEESGATSDTVVIYDSAVVDSNTYKIKKGDSYWKIAKIKYGSYKYFKAIEKANPDIDPNQLREGMIIKLPPAEKVIKKRPVLPVTEPVKDRPETVEDIPDGVPQF